MASSKAFAQIREDAIRIIKSIPCGKVTTYGEIGRYMTVAPRHIAYILSQLKPEEQDEIAWYRVVGESGKLGKAKTNARGQTQSELLAAESISVSRLEILGFEDCFLPVSQLNAGVAQGKNYSD